MREFLKCVANAKLTFLREPWMHDSEIQDQ